MLNHSFVMGRLTRDPELRSAGETKVCNFTVACDRDYSPQGGERETDFIECIAWRTTAEFICNHFTKGQLIVISGRLQVRDWTDKEGNKRKVTEIKVASAYFAGSAPGSKSVQASVPAVDVQAGAFSELSDEDGDLPF